MTHREELQCIVFSLHFYHSWNAWPTLLVNIQEIQPGGPKARKQQACKTGINTIFLMSSIFTPQHHLSITDIDAHVFLHSPANRHI